MREMRLSGSEGGVAGEVIPTPIQKRIKPLGFGWEGGNSLPPQGGVRAPRIPVPKRSEPFLARQEQPTCQLSWERLNRRY